MKLILLQPPIRDFYDTGIRLQPLGLCMLKAAVKRHIPDVEVIVKDYHQGRGRRTIPYPKEFSYLKEFYRYHDKGPFSTFHHLYHFDAGFDEIAEDVAKDNPDLVGISSLFSPYYRDALACAKAVKRIIHVPVIMGGPHVSAATREILKVSDKRRVLGAEILRRLLRGKRLYAATGNGMKVIDRFKSDLFFMVWERMPYVRTLTGGRIDLRGLFPS